jgi:hypothetical protein|tara:strand:- start:1458 stop:1868 length:411 start_codon:yes stop_codon:yes gene_type:complete
MKEKYTLIFGIGIIFSLITAMAFFARENVDFVEYILVGLVLILIFVSTVIMGKRAKDLKSKLPVKDELTRLNTLKAGYFTFIANVWILVGLIWYNSFFVDNFGLYQLSTEQALGFDVLISGVIFFGLYFYFNRTPK